MNVSVKDGLKTKRYRAHCFFLASIVSILGCGEPSLVVPCDEARPPIVMVHGFLAAGDTWNQHSVRFRENRHCPDSLYAFDWNSLDREADHVAALDALIKGVLTTHDTDRVDLIGHSAGGGLGYSLLEDAERAQQVRKYVHIGSFPSEAPAGPSDAPVPTLNLWSTGDTVVEGADIEGATNVNLGDADHYAVATNQASFDAIYAFLNGVAPSPTVFQNGRTPTLSGKFLTLGENQAVEGSTIKLYALTEGAATRQDDGLDVAVAANGAWGPLEVTAGETVEFVATHPNEMIPDVRHFYRVPDVDQPRVYLRTFPDPTTLAGILTQQFHASEDKAILVVYHASGSFLFGRDSLKLDGQELLTETNASAAKTTIALFIFDVNDDDEPDGSAPLFDTFPFLAAVDKVIEDASDTLMNLNFNGQTLILPKSGRGDGILLAIVGDE